MSIVKVEREWDDSFGFCYDCGDPAAYAAPDRYGPDHELSDNNLLCAVCAALANATESERIVYLWTEDDDPVTEENKAVIDFYNETRLKPWAVVEHIGADGHPLPRAIVHGRFTAMLSASEFIENTFPADRVELGHYGIDGPNED
jgi:hypothetical protein